MTLSPDLAVFNKRLLQNQAGLVAPPCQRTVCVDAPRQLDFAIASKGCEPAFYITAWKPCLLGLILFRKKYNF
jgi:hypothetical protein